MIAADGAQPMECAAFQVSNNYVWKYSDQKGQITDFKLTEQQETVKNG